jgi:hypothetical protein
LSGVQAESFRVGSSELPLLAHRRALIEQSALLLTRRHGVVRRQELRFMRRLVGVMHRTKQLKIDRIVDRL